MFLLLHQMKRVSIFQYVLMEFQLEFELDIDRGFYECFGK